MEKEQFAKFCALVFKLAKPYGAEVIMDSTDGALTRFADNAVSQNVAIKSRSITIKIAEKGRMSRVSINSTDEKTVRAAVARAVEMLKEQKRDPALLDLPKPVKPGGPEPEYFDPAIAKFSPVGRAAIVKACAACCERRGQLASGTVSHSVLCIGVANSLGVMRHNRRTSFEFDVTIHDGPASGWASVNSWQLKKVNIQAALAHASGKAALAKNPRDLKPGKYTVILEPDPVGELLLFSAWNAFNGKKFNDGTSFMSGKIGQKVLGENITICDDAFNPLNPALPFDFEGANRTRVSIVENGVARGVVHDRKTAKQAKTKTTGHSLPQPNGAGALAMNLTLSPGKSSLAELIKNTKRGILVSQLHYVNVIRPREVELTGMTRNGTFYIENGKIKYAIKNMRFTDSVLRILNNVEELGADLFHANASWGGSFMVPCIKVKDFNFSSSTGF